MPHRVTIHNVNLVITNVTVMFIHLSSQALYEYSPVLGKFLLDCLHYSAHSPVWVKSSVE